MIPASSNSCADIDLLLQKFTEATGTRKYLFGVHIWSLVHVIDLIAWYIAS